MDPFCRLNKASILFKMISLLALCALASCASLTSKHEGHSQGRFNSEGMVIENYKFVDVEFPVEIKHSAQHKLLESELEKLVLEAKAKGEEAIHFLLVDFYLKASDATLRHDSKTAVVFYKNLLELAPEEEELLRKYAVELIKLGRLEVALSVVEQIYHLDTKDNNVALILAGIYTALDQRDRAQEVYSTVLKHQPGNREACIFLAKSLAESDDARKADNILKECSSLSQLEEEKAIFTYYRATLALEERKMEDGLALLRQALVHNPHFFQGVSILGLVLQEQSRFEEAAKVYEDYLTRDPINRSILNQLVNLRFAQEDFLKALPYARRLVRLDPNNLNLKVRVGVIYSDLGEYEQAIDIFEEILQDAPDADRVLFYVAALYQKTGRYDQAIARYSQISPQSPLFHESIMQITDILGAFVRGELSGVEMGRFPADSENMRASYDFEEFARAQVKEHPELKFQMHINMTLHYDQLNKPQEAIKWLSAVTKDENFNSAHLYYLAALYERDNQYDKSVTLMKKVLELEPDHAHALNFLGYTMLVRNKDLDEAYSYISRAIELLPEDGHIRDSLGWYYYKRGDLESAYREVKKAMKLLEEEEMEVVKHLAIIYRDMGQYQKSEYYFKQALELCQNDEEKQKVAELLQELQTQRSLASEKP